MIKLAQSNQYRSKAAFDDYAESSLAFLISKKLSDKNKDYKFTIVSGNAIRMEYTADKKQIAAFILLS